MNKNWIELEKGFLNLDYLKCIRIHGNQILYVFSDGSTYTTNYENNNDIQEYKNLLSEQLIT